VATTLTPPEPKTAPGVDGGGALTTPPPAYGGGGGRGPFSNASLVQRYKLGVWVGVGGIIMFFAAMTSAMVVRTGLSGDWKAFDVPRILFFSTAVLLISSFTLEAARRRMIAKEWAAVRLWVNLTTALGLIFLTCQVLGWQALAERGLFLASNPANSFYYVLTIGHAVHLAGGVLSLGYVFIRVRVPRRWATREPVIEAVSLYWHFMDVLWIYILGLLVFWR
jgi:cytochrome c oxidase subunit 3